MAQRGRENLTPPVLGSPPLEKEVFEDRAQVRVLLKSLLHQQRVMQLYRRRGERRPLARS
jgi:hypothetical protein